MQAPSFSGASAANHSDALPHLVFTIFSNQYRIKVHLSYDRRLNIVIKATDNGSSEQTCTYTQPTQLNDGWQAFTSTYNTIYASAIRQISTFEF